MVTVHLPPALEIVILFIDQNSEPFQQRTTNKPSHNTFFLERNDNATSIIFPNQTNPQTLMLHF